MSAIMAMIVMASSTAAVVSPYLPPSSIGESHEVTQLHWPWTQPANVSVKENVNVFIPPVSLIQAANGVLPVMFFYGGFGANMPSAAYSDLLNSIASKGDGAIIVAWDALFTNPINITNAASKATDIYTWAIASNGLQLVQFISTHFTSIKSFPSPITPDFTRTFFSGHSSGNQLAVLMAEKFPFGVKGLALLDPVDSDPFKLTKPVIPVNGTVDSLVVPVIVVASELCEQSGISAVGLPPCCPAGYDNLHFYNAFQNAPKFDIVAKYYGHADLLDPVLAWFAHFSHFCATVSDAWAHPFKSYIDLVSGSVSSFLAVFGNGKCEYATYLTDASKFNTPGFLKTDNLQNNFCF